jgi:hypothetical protein
MLSRRELQHRMEEARRLRESLPDAERLREMLSDPSELARRAHPLVERVAAARHDLNLGDPAAVLHGGLERFGERF